MTVGQVLNDPATDKGLFSILNPDIAFAREVVLALYASNFFLGAIETVCLDELWSKGTCRRWTY
jgi:hypothetical protein